MKLSTKGRYGTRALLELAIHQGEGPVSLKDISQRQEISLQYLEHLITPLIAGGIVKSTRGARGGVYLARAAGEIKLSEIIRILEGSTAPVDCVDKSMVCPRSDFCAARDIWSDLKNAVDSVLDKITLQELVERQKSKEQSKAVMYYI
jgi:Rrf2 family protein